MYKIIGADGREYGPVTVEQMHQWIADGRVNAQTRAEQEGSNEWKSLSAFSEFAAVLAPPPLPSAPGAPPQVAFPAKTSGLAIASLVLGVIGFVLCGLSSLFGLILGIVALKKIKTSGGRLGGGGLAVGGICASSASLLLMLTILPALLLPALQGARERALRVSCMSNQKQIALACQLFALDSGGRFPTQLSELFPKYLASQRPLHCPSSREPEGKITYVYVSGLTGKDSDKILLYDLPENHREGRVVVFGDGHGKWMTEEAFQSLLSEQGGGGK